MTIFFRLPCQFKFEKQAATKKSDSVYQRISPAVDSKNSLHPEITFGKENSLFGTRNVETAEQISSFRPIFGYRKIADDDLALNRKTPKTRLPLAT